MFATIASYLVLIISGLLVSIPIPLIVLGSRKNISNFELVKSYPQFAWIKRRHNTFLKIVFLLLIAFFIFILLSENNFGARYYLLFVPFLCAISLYDGILSLSTGVYIFWDRYGYTHYYDPDGEKNWIAEVQIGLAIILIVTSLLLYFL